jgi:hypothetical protein
VQRLGPLSVVTRFVIRASFFILLVNPRFLEYWMVIIDRFVLHTSLLTCEIFRGRESGGDAWKQYVRWSACTSESAVT